MKFNLVDIHGVDPDVQVHRGVKCLEVDGVAECNDALKEFERSVDARIFSDLIATISSIGKKPKLRTTEPIKRTRRRHIWQVKRARHPLRLYFFIDESSEPCAVFVSSFLKRGVKDTNAQDGAIQKAEAMRKTYLMKVHGI
jgi:hypothetical protein